MKKFLLVPGHVFDFNAGGKWRYVGPSELAGLYGVRLEECLILGQDVDGPLQTNLTILTVRKDGKYKLMGQ